MDLRPRIIFWETTKKCNLACSYCRMMDGNKGPELSTSKAFEMIQDIRNAFGKPVLVLSGGEPLLRKDIFEVIYHASRVGLPVALATNGVLLGDKEAGTLKTMGVRRVSISLDSAESAAHDSSRGVKGAFAKTIDAAGHLKKHGLPFQINFTVSKQNKNELRNVAEYALALGAAAVHYFVLVPVGCGKEMDGKTMLDAEENEEALSEIKALSRELPIEMRPTCAPQYVRFDDEGNYGGCIAGRGAMFISSEGDIYPCGYLPVKAGSLGGDSIKSIWENSPVFGTLRGNEIKGACAECGVKDRCRGCRARAYGLTGDMMAGDDSCVLSRESCQPSAVSLKDISI